MMPDISNSQKECLDLTDYSPAMVPPPPPLLSVLRKRKAISINISELAKKCPSLSSPPSTSPLSQASSILGLSEPAFPVPTIEAGLAESSSDKLLLPNLHIGSVIPLKEDLQMNKNQQKKKKRKIPSSNSLKRTDEFRILRDLQPAQGIYFGCAILIRIFFLFSCFFLVFKGTVAPA